MNRAYHRQQSRWHRIGAPNNVAHLRFADRASSRRAQDVALRRAIDDRYPRINADESYSSCSVYTTRLRNTIAGPGGVQASRMKTLVFVPP